MTAGRVLGTALAIGLMLAHAAPVFAHAERIRSKPDEGERAAAPPAALRIDFSEPPIGDARFVVLDGCGNDVVEDIDVHGTTIDAGLSRGQPGHWQVETRVVSGVDGHATSDAWSFSVRGFKDCSRRPEDTAPPSAGDDDETPSGSGTFLLVVAAGTLAVIVLALAVRHKA